EGRGRKGLARLRAELAREPAVPAPRRRRHHLQLRSGRGRAAAAGQLSRAMLRFLCVSDIHGHQRALEAVLAEADALGWDQLVACGDLLFPGPEPLKVWETLRRHNAVCVQGIGDRALAHLDASKL